MMKHEFKLFGIKWDLRPVYWFVLACVILGLFCMHLTFAFTGEPFGAILSALAIFIIYYVVIQIHNNELNKG